MQANARTGGTILRLDTPLARMATISPSAAMRPSPIRMPASTPKGMVIGSTGGMASANSSATVPMVAVVLRTRRSNSLSNPYRKMTNVASSVPSSALVRISRNT